MSKINRRDFIRTTAGTAALAMAGSRAFGANERIRVAVIGVRNRGNQVAESMFKTGRFELAAFCDCDSAMYERALKTMKEKPEKDPKYLQDFRRALEDRDIDAVVVATPDHWHAVATVLALEAGKHVYVEKPMTFNINEGKAMMAAAAAHPELVVQVGTQQRSGQHFKDACAFVREGGLGKVGFARAWITQVRDRLPIVTDCEPPDTMDYEMWCGPGPFLPYNESLRHYNWHFTKAYGTGEMGNWGAHWIDIVRWFLDLDLPLAVSGHGGTFVVRDAKETPDTQTAIYQFPELTVLWEQRIWSRFPVQGEGSGAELVGEKGGLVISRGGWTFTPHKEKPQSHDSSEMEVAHADNFADSIQGRAKPAAPIGEGHKTAVMCHLANIVVGLGRSVVFNPVAQNFPNDAEAQQMLGRENRAPWPVFQV
jgi:predicted dehydrogenase